ncbi:hypothetical protein N4R57_11135 [Rhodobacteraceae bacterium D3-12]|nr:hypothetical protein N4R57_11135 [Rhodobacteraceae bacterium D3-12]
MSEIETGRWTLEGVEAGEALSHLPGFEKVMVVLRNGGATHERIGAVDTVKRGDDGLIALGQDVHTARIDPGQVCNVVLDTTSEMRGKVYPALEFADADGETLFSVIGMDGAAGFVAAFDGVPKGAAEGKRREMPSASEAPEDLSGDPGFALLDQLRAAESDVTIRLSLSGRTQSWHGQIETVRPAMGFANVMTADFHLHLKAGAVETWRKDGGRHVALNSDGVEIGLVIDTVEGQAA